jgi:hypothetical protein
MAQHPELFHYTNPAAFDGIAQSQSLWCSHYRERWQIRRFKTQKSARLTNNRHHVIVVSKQWRWIRILIVRPCEAKMLKATVDHLIGRTGARRQGQ